MEILSINVLRLTRDMYLVYIYRSNEGVTLSDWKIMHLLPNWKST